MVAVGVAVSTMVVVGAGVTVIDGTGVAVNSGTAVLVSVRGTNVGVTVGEGMPKGDFEQDDSKNAILMQIMKNFLKSIF